LTGTRPKASLRPYFEAMGASVRGIFSLRGMGIAVAALSLAVAGTYSLPTNAQNLAVSPFQGSHFHPFVAIEGGGGWQNTNFAVTPNFNVGGSSFIGGINGGFLFDVAGTPISIGPRIGLLGGDMPGSIAHPPASLPFVYDVKTKTLTTYEEAIVSILLRGVSFSGGKVRAEPLPQSAWAAIYASLGAAQVRTQVTGTAGAFQVIDSATRTGITGSVGVSLPISQNFLGGGLLVYGQYRITALQDATLNLPAPVHIDSGWIQGVTFGLQARY
jgi:hypothetical protein